MSDKTTWHDGWDAEDMTWDDADGRYPVTDDDDEPDVPLHCQYCGGFMAYWGIDDGCGDYGDAIADIFMCVECGHTEERNPMIFADDTDMSQDNDEGAMWSADLGRYKAHGSEWLVEKITEDNLCDQYKQSDDWRRDYADNETDITWDEYRTICTEKPKYFSERDMEWLQSHSPTPVLMAMDLDLLMADDDCMDAAGEKLIELGRYWGYRKEMVKTLFDFGYWWGDGEYGDALVNAL